MDKEARKIILHLCADIGSDSRYYDLHKDYEVIKVGVDIGVENFTPPSEVYGVIANPVCTEFSNANHNNNKSTKKGMFLVNHCIRIIKECNPVFWVIENPATGSLKDFLGKPNYVYQPWWYGSPWTKRTALWGKFNTPERLHNNWSDVTKNEHLYVRPGRPKPSLAFLHKSAIHHLPEYRYLKDKIRCDADLRSICSDGFARSFFNENR